MAQGVQNWPDSVYTEDRAADHCKFTTSITAGHYIRIRQGINISYAIILRATNRCHQGSRLRCKSGLRIDDGAI